MSATGRGGERLEADNYPTPAWCVRRLLEVAEDLEIDCNPPGTYGDRYWLEPCAGDGAIVRAVSDWCYAQEAPFVAPIWTANEIRPAALSELEKRVGRSGNVYNLDYLSAEFAWHWHVGITNPPFSLALPFAQKMLRECDTVVLLLRLNWLGTVDRGGWLRDHMPDVYVLPNRPEFVASLKCGGAVGYFIELDRPARRQVDKSQRCEWRAKLPIDAERPKVCPGCGGAVQCSTTDATEYAWFVWPKGGHDRSRGELRILAETPEAERHGG